MSMLHDFCDSSMIVVFQKFIFRTRVQYMSCGQEWIKTKNGGAEVTFLKM